MSKQDKNPKEERGKKKAPEMCLKEEPAETATERTTAISPNGRMPLQTKPKKNKPIHNHKQRYDPGMNK
jgi:hypothetical protein